MKFLYSLSSLCIKADPLNVILLKEPIIKTQCSCIYICPQRIRQKFSIDEKYLLLRARKSGASWKAIKNAHFPSRNLQVIIQAWFRVKKKLQQIGLHPNAIDSIFHSKVIEVLTTPRFKWTTEYDQVLLEKASKQTPINWDKLASSLDKRLSDIQVYMRYNSLIDMSSKGRWSTEETNRLKFAVATFGNHWRLVSEFVGTRNMHQCRTKWLNHLYPDLSHTQWTPEESNKLLQLVLDSPTLRLLDGLPSYSDIDWTELACNFPDRNGIQCWHHFFSQLESRVREHLRLIKFKRGRWDAQETARLLALVEQHSTNWKQIASELRTRSLIQCKTHWQTLKQRAQNQNSSNINQRKDLKRSKPRPLSPSNKRMYTPFTVAEDEALLRLYRLFGPKWTLIAWCESILLSRRLDTLRQRFLLITKKTSGPSFTLLSI
ncbi:Myblike DNAbinding domain-containing protein [Entomophthora muscae]|uniref:Myblike DNAbinding domain-containing protein n=1 Tax=Entomophthora muscae TaxID=34485 RepID=A0ACC2RSB7_9FUNG|nr:Myblike DNAbinding domain-containing protein [Entomophthora muscae]